jgi:cytochrome P450
MSAFELICAQRRHQTRESFGLGLIGRAVDEADKNNTWSIAELLPGPLKDARSREEKVRVANEMSIAIAQGRNVQLYAEWQLRHGDRGLSTNIVVPDFNTTTMSGSGLPSLSCRVVVADPDDAERIARVHTRKDGSFKPVLFDSVISTTDNEHWQSQRRELSEVFLPLSSLSEIMPVSLARAKVCGGLLSNAAASQKPVDMSDFLLHEAQAQLQLALLGLDEDFMNATNRDMRKVFNGSPEAPVGKLSEHMAELMKRAKADTTLGLPSDGKPVHGPLSRALQLSSFDPATNYGNALLILFAGHDTTGHAMTWLLFELSRHPEYQRKLQREVDEFFGALGGRDPQYADLSRLTFMDKCITETLRLWSSVPNGTFRQLQFDDSIKGEGGKSVTLPKGTHMNVVTWSRHRNPDLWGPDVNTFNPHREFQPEELMRVGSATAAKNPQSRRFSPFVHGPRNCLGRNFAQMEMRLIIAYLLRRYSFSLAPPYDKLAGETCGPTADPSGFFGVNVGTMGPLDLVNRPDAPWGKFNTVGMHLFVHERATA